MMSGADGTCVSITNEMSFFENREDSVPVEQLAEISVARTIQTILQVVSKGRKAG